MVYFRQKVPLIKELLKEKHLETVLIFSATKKNVKTVCNDLINNGFNAKSIHSDLKQNEREEILRLFKNKKVQILVATDILSRGIDINGVNLVINYDVPWDAEDYVHRVGRTARADATGVAITFISERDQNEFFKIEKLLGYDIYKIPVPAIIGESPVYSPGKKSSSPRSAKINLRPDKKRKFRSAKARHFSKGKKS